MTGEPQRTRPGVVVFGLLFALAAWVVFGRSDGVLEGGIAEPVTWSAPATDPSYRDGRWLAVGVTTRRATLANRWWSLPSRVARPYDELAAWEAAWRRAAVWAGTRAGTPFPVAWQVTGVAAGSAAEVAGLLPGDLVVAVDGRPLDTVPPELVLALRPPGQLPLTVVRSGFTIEVGWDDRGGDLGVRFVESGDVPILWMPHSEAVGASAGLAQALAYLDAVTLGDLTGGRVVAATGVLYTDGSLSAIEGLEHKLPAAFAEGADIVLVAAGSVVPAGFADDPRVVPVASADEAVGWLCATGGTGPCP